MGQVVSPAEGAGDETVQHLVVLRHVPQNRRVSDGAGQLHRHRRIGLERFHFLQIRNHQLGAEIRVILLNAQGVSVGEGEHEENPAENHRRYLKGETLLPFRRRHAEHGKQHAETIHCPGCEHRGDQCGIQSKANQPHQDKRRGSHGDGRNCLPPGIQNHANAESDHRQHRRNQPEGLEIRQNQRIVTPQIFQKVGNQLPRRGQSVAHVAGVGGNHDHQLEENQSQCIPRRGFQAEKPDLPDGFPAVPHPQCQCNHQHGENPRRRLIAGAYRQNPQPGRKHIRRSIPVPAQQRHHRRQHGKRHIRRVKPKADTAEEIGIQPQNRQHRQFPAGKCRPFIDNIPHEYPGHRHDEHGKDLGQRRGVRQIIASMHQRCKCRREIPAEIVPLLVPQRRPGGIVHIVEICPKNGADAHHENGKQNQQRLSHGDAGFPGTKGFRFRPAVVLLTGGDIIGDHAPRRRSRRDGEERGAKGDEQPVLHAEHPRHALHFLGIDPVVVEVHRQRAVERKAQSRVYGVGQQRPHPLPGDGQPPHRGAQQHCRHAAPHKARHPRRDDQQQKRGAGKHQQSLFREKSFFFHVVSPFPYPWGLWEALTVRKRFRASPINHAVRISTSIRTHFSMSSVGMNSKRPW